MRGTTRLSFSGDRLDLRLPRAWDELTQDQLDRVLWLLSNFTPGEAAAYATVRLSGLRVEGRSADGRTVAASIPRRWGRRTLVLQSWQLDWAARQMEWIGTPPSVPVRLERVGGCRAVDAAWHGLPFGDYLKVENLWQGFLATRSAEPLEGAARLLYRRADGTPPRRLDAEEHELLGVSYWISGAREMLATAFPDLFARSSAGGGAPDMRRAMDTQLRALTGGDATKEEAVLRLDCWRALTELDATAREAHELKDKIKRMGHGTR